MPFLVHDFKGEEDLTESPLFRKQQTIDHAYPIDLELPDLAIQMIDVDVTAPGISNLFHCGSYRRRVFIAHLIQEVPNRLPAG